MISPSHIRNSKITDSRPKGREIWLKNECIVSLNRFSQSFLSIWGSVCALLSKSENTIFRSILQ